MCGNWRNNTFNRWTAQPGFQRWDRLTATLSPRRDAACRLRCPPPVFARVEKGQEMLDEQLQRAVAQGFLVGLEGPLAGVIALELDASLEDQQGSGSEGDGRCRVEIALARGGRLAGHDADRLGEGGVPGKQVERRAGQVAFGGCGGRGIVEGGGQGEADVRRGGDVGRGGAQAGLSDCCQDLDGGGVVESGHWLGSVGKGPSLASRQMASSFCLSAGGAGGGRGREVSTPCFAPSWSCVSANATIERANHLPLCSKLPCIPAMVPSWP